VSSIVEDNSQGGIVVSSGASLSMTNTIVRRNGSPTSQVGGVFFQSGATVGAITGCTFHSNQVGHVMHGLVMSSIRACQSVGVYDIVPWERGQCTRAAQCAWRSVPLSSHGLLQLCLTGRPVWEEACTSSTPR
jgi:hypothetical protein